jgi:hypothetical protein
MRWVGHVAHVGGGEKCITIFWLENLKGRDHSEDFGIDGRILSEWIFRKRVEMCELMNLAQDRDH